MPDSHIPIDFSKQPGGRYFSVLHRADGVAVRLEGGSYNRIGGSTAQVPHDIAHLVIEELLELRAGLWGTLAAGGIVQNATFAGGRKPPHAERRARAITDRAGESLRQAEILVRAVADASLEPAIPDLHVLHSRVGDRWWPATASVEAYRAACAGLREVAARWNRLPESGTLRLVWRLEP